MKQKFKNMNLLSLIPKFENRRVRIVYDAPYPAISLLYKHILPFFNPDNLFFVVYSDAVCRRLREMYKSFKDECPEIAQILDNAKFIKIGQKICSPFSESECRIGSERLNLIHEKSVLENYIGLESVSNNLSNNCFTVFAGLYMLPAIYGPSAIKSIHQIFSSLPKETTLFSFYPEGFLEPRQDKSLEKLYDIILRVKRENEFFYFGEDTYLMGVDHSIVKDIRPGFGRYTIDENWNLIEV